MRGQKEHTDKLAFPITNCVKLKPHSSTVNQLTVAFPDWEKDIYFSSLSELRLFVELVKGFCLCRPEAVEHFPASEADEKGTVTVASLGAVPSLKASDWGEGERRVAFGEFLVALAYSKNSTELDWLQEGRRDGGEGNKTGVNSGELLLSAVSIPSDDHHDEEKLISARLLPGEEVAIQPVLCRLSGEGKEGGQGASSLYVTNFRLVFIDVEAPHYSTSAPLGFFSK